MKDKKIMDLCLFCVEEPTKECYKEHKDWVEEISYSNVLTADEKEQWRK